jgi:hypothetical protein
MRKFPRQLGLGLGFALKGEIIEAPKSWPSLLNKLSNERGAESRQRRPTWTHSGKSF